MIMGIVVGAGVVIFALLCILVGYRVWSRKRRKNSKKYLYHQPGRPMGSNMNHIPSQVTLLPINNVSRGHSRLDTTSSHGHGQLPRINGRGQLVPRSPPPYNESFLDNGGSIVAVWRKTDNFFILFIAVEKLEGFKVQCYKSIIFISKLIFSYKNI